MQPPVPPSRPPSLQGHPHPALEAAAKALVAAGARLAAGGLIVATEGNLSIRLGPYAIAITPAGRRKDELEPADIVVVAIEAEPDEARRPVRASSDVAFHRAIYAARPDVLAIAHAHLPVTLALMAAGIVPHPEILAETALALPRLGFVPFEEPGSTALAAAVGAAMAGSWTAGAALLEGHGAVAAGRTIDEAVDRLETIEMLSRVWRDAMLLGGDPRRLQRAPDVPGAAARTPRPIRRRP
ncbi:MAG: class II aldolase/adducin family protein [Chloroflexi bacterium]|jgi:L-fuculose-phosphate aldolase|nr:class II aldolase/adducin family protein [Chloroflexota bacterium]